MRIAIIGATGLVGREMLTVLEERNFPVTELIPVASQNSVGKVIRFKNREHVVISIEEAVSKHPDIALFSAGSKTSWNWAPVFSKNGTYVIDNSSAWRMDEKIKLVVPEINADIIEKEDKLIANPNCSTIQMIMALGPLHKEFTIKRIIVSTYQSVSGSGAAALKQLECERKGSNDNKHYPYEIDKNCIPHCDDFTENGYTKEELKLVNETRKILNDSSIRISATAVRVPVTGGHSESVNIEFEKECSIDKIRKILAESKGIVLKDDPSELLYPMPRSVRGNDEVFVGRIRKDISHKNAINLWVVADNLRKGAATNAIQIAEYLIEKKYSTTG